MKDNSVRAALTEHEGERQFVVFSLNDESYAVAARVVQEILELTTITPVPHLPQHFKGVINLRGLIVPVVDLKLKLGMSSPIYGKHTCIVVLESTSGAMGVVVDTVSDVMHIAREAVSEAPSFGERIRTDFILGMVKSAGALVMLLDIDKVLTSEDTINMDDARAYSEALGGGA